MIFGYWKVKGIKRNRDADIREIVKITQMIFADIEKVYVGLPRNFLLESTEIANIKVKLIIIIKKFIMETVVLERIVRVFRHYAFCNVVVFL